MTIGVDIVAGNFAYGNPGSLGEPLGLWNAQADVTGDGSGGHISVRFQPQNPTLTPALPDQRLEFVYFVDGATIFVNTDPGNVSCRVRTHMARSNAAIAVPFEQIIARDTIQVETNVFAPAGELVPVAWKRTPVFWDTQELTAGEDDIVLLSAQTNTNLSIYRARAYGRYYDRQILSNRAFSRLVSPEAVSQFA